MAQPELIKDIEARVIRPTSTDNAIVRFNGTTGQIQNTGNTIDDSNNTIIYGNTTINGSISDTPLYITSKSSSTWIRFLNGNDTELGYLGITSTGPAFYKSTTFPILHSGNYNSYAPTLTGTGANGTWNIAITGNAATATALTSSAGSTGQAIYFDSGKPVAIDWRIGNSGVGEHNCNNITYNFCGYYTSNGPATSIGATTADGAIWSQAYSTSWVAQIAQDYRDGDLFIRGKNNGAWTAWKRIWVTGDSVTGAVWNDYAECREADTIQPGYVLVETGNDTLTKSTERLSPFAGVSSDTWGFSQGETDKAKTHIAVAGRVLVYPWQDRNNYKPGDCVCAAPEGKVDIMTREEIIQYPDRIVGTVSSVPIYDKWGGGENADREPVDVNGRIWIKVR